MESLEKRRRLKERLGGKWWLVNTRLMNRLSSNCEGSARATCRTGASTAAKAEEFAAQQPRMICTETGEYRKGTKASALKSI